MPGALFRYDRDVVATFPTIVGGVVHATGVVNGPGGTGHGARMENVTVAGKTGTAQVISLDSQTADKAHKDHAWFTSFAPAEAPEIAVTVLVEHGGKGGAVAAPLAKKIIETYFQLKKERKANDNV